MFRDFALDQDRDLARISPPMDTKTHIQASILRIRAFVRDGGLTLSGVARRAGLRESTIRHVNDDGWNPTRETLEKLEMSIPEDFPECAS